MSNAKQKVTIAEIWVSELKLNNFRNFKSLALILDAAPVVLTGQNGAGKTNLLEAVSYLSHGKGLRNSRMQDLPHFNGGLSNPWAVHAVLHSTRERFTIGTGQDLSKGREKRLIKLDGEFLRAQAELMKKISITWLTPAHDRLLQEGASDRRRFFDRLIGALYTDHIKHGAIYERTLRERSILLRNENFDEAWLELLENRLVKYGTKIIEARLQFCLKINTVIKNEIIDFPQAELTLTGGLENSINTMDASDFEQFYFDQLKQSRISDRDSGRSAVGPHRCDFNVWHKNNQKPASLCSTGEQKALLITIVLAHARMLRGVWQRPPLMLLDEVIAHLDPHRRDAFCQEVVNLGIQAWLTGTDQDFFGSLRSHAQFLKISEAKVLSD
jgi:DNA replication and repair protein RecF